MKKIYILKMFSLLILLGNTLTAQNLQLTPNPTLNAVCPGDQITYNVSHSVTTCAYYWEITGGTFSGGGTTSSGNNLTITWGSSNLGTISITTSSCSNGDYNDNTLNVNVPIKSVAGLTPTQPEGPSSVTVNTSPTLRYTIDLLQYTRRGTNDSNPFDITTYQWQVPSGWTITNQSHSIADGEAYLDVTPDNCTSGNIRVRAKNSCGEFYGNWSTVKTVTRTVANPGEITGPSYVVCNDLTPLHFSVPAVTGATSYVWTKPSSGWSGTSTTNSITLTPDGTSGGNVTVKAVGCSLQSTTASVKSIPLEFFNPSTAPAVTGPSVIECTGETFTLNNVPAGATVTWHTSPGYFQTNSGSGNSATLIPADLSIGGPGIVIFTVSTACGNFQVQSNNFSVQGLLPGVINFTNSENEGMYFCSSSYGNYFEIETGAPGTNFEARLLDITGQTVLYTSPTTTYQAGTPYLWSYYPSTSGYYLFEVRGTNGCGSTSWVGTEVEYVDCSWFFSVYPNPAANYVDIEMPDYVSKAVEAELYQMTLIDDTGTELLKITTKDKKKRIDTSNLRKGQYILRIRYKGELTFQRIVIDR